MQPQTGSTFRQRFGYYACGLAIGFVMLGLLRSGKQIATQPPAGGATSGPSQSETPSKGTAGAETKVPESETPQTPTGQAPR